MKMDDFFRLKMEMETRQDKNDEKQKKMKKTRRRHIKNMLTIFFIDLGDFYQWWFKEIYHEIDENEWDDVCIDG